MRSTLLFVAVLLACTPVHAQTTAPPEAPILTAWLSAILPAATQSAVRKTVAKRRVTPNHPPTPANSQPFTPLNAAEPPTTSAPPLLHSPNAP